MIHRLLSLALLAIVALTLTSFSRATAAEIQIESESAAAPRSAVFSRGGHHVRSVEAETSDGTHAKVEYYSSVPAGDLVAKTAKAIKQLPVEKPEGTCPTEALKRISLCQKIVRYYLTPNSESPLIVPFRMGYSSKYICHLIKQDFPKLHQKRCLPMADHILAVAGSNNHLIEASKAMDNHDLCLFLLSTPPNGSKKRYIKKRHNEICKLEHTGGITGARCLIFPGQGFERLTYATTFNGHTPKHYGPGSNEGYISRLPGFSNLDQELDGLCDVRFFVTDSETRGWDNRDYQRELCAAIAKYEPHAVFSFGMSSLALASARLDADNDPLLEGCKQFSRSPTRQGVTWFTVHSPWRGMLFANAWKKSCPPFYRPSSNFVHLVRSQEFISTGLCNKQAYYSLATDYASNTGHSYQALFDGSRQVIKGGMCGMSPMSILPETEYSRLDKGNYFQKVFGRTLLYTMQELPKNAPHGLVMTDGITPIDSCTFGAAFFNRPDNSLYMGRFNFQDAGCRRPDPKSKPNETWKRPCEWFRNRVIQTRSELSLSPTGSSNVDDVDYKSYVKV